MNYRFNVFLCMFFLFASVLSTTAQIDRSNKGGILIEAEPSKANSDSSLRSERKAGLSNSNNGFTLSPTTPKLPSEGNLRTVDMSPKVSKFIDQRYDKQPKWAEDKTPVDQSFSRDQYLGNVKTNAKFVEVFFRDFGIVDGDRVKIYLNEEVIAPNIILSGGYYGMLIDIEPGFNKLDFKAISTGEVGPNTADLKVIDDKGQIISSNQWNLDLGYKATIIIVK